MNPKSNFKKWITLSATAAILALSVALTGNLLAVGDKNLIEDAVLDTSVMPIKGGATQISDLGVSAPTYSAFSTVEIEPNGTAPTATMLATNAVRVRGDIYRDGDVDFFAFYANAGDRVFAATMTNGGQGGTNSTLDLIGPDGTTIIETDLDDGTFGGTSSSIAGRSVAASGIHYLRVVGSTATTQIRFYDLYLRVQSGSPTAEVEPNDSVGTATPLGSNGNAVGAISSATDAADLYSFSAKAGDTVSLSLDLDPERDTTTWNARLGLSTFSGFTLVINDANIVSPNSEAFMFTVKETGTYFAFVDPATAATGTATSTYNLSVTVHPAKESKCTTYTTASAPRPIGPDPASPSAVQTINIPDNKRISKAMIGVTLTHAKMADIDLNITSPSGNEMALFNDVGSATANVANLTDMDVVFNDDAAIPIGAFTVVKPMHYQTENFTRLAWLNGENAQGTWTLIARDDLAGDAGTLTSWNVTICEDPGVSSIPASEQAIYSSDFETDDGGFTHAGTADEWERGLPSTVVTGAAIFNSCNSGVNCWKTDLDNTYNNSGGVGQRVDQILTSPNIDLTNQRGRAIKLSWAHRYQIESASFDHYFVDVVEVGGSGMTRRVWEHKDGTMTGIVGSPNVTLQGSAGWSTLDFDISEFAGKTIQVKFQADADDTVVFGGAAVDDVKVIALKSPPGGDFDADGGSDLSVYRNNAEDGGDGRWYVLNSSNGNVVNQLFGLDTDVPVAGDYDGDGDNDIAVFRGSEGRWYISLGSQFNFNVINFGTSGDIPVPADYDGDGKTDAAVFRAGQWIIKRSSDNAVQWLSFGLSGDVLVPRDFDGDGKADPAVFRGGVWYILQSFYGTARIENFGLAGDTAVAADYDGDRRADIAVFRAGTWYIRNSSNGVVNTVSWGLGSDTPAQGDYDRDRKADIAVYRAGTWFILRSSDGALAGPAWGIAGDVPIPPK